MRRRIPSISSLIAFDAAARHSSITRAAGELALTESAVSRQISQLENFLDVQLFHRIKKRLSLTRAGAAYAREVATALERLERNTYDVMAHEGANSTLEIAALPTVGSLWLVPRLAGFLQRHPNITVNLGARSDHFLFSESAIDGALCFGNGQWPGAQTEHLFNERLLVVAGGPLLRTSAPWPIETVLQQPLLHLMTRPFAWTAWGAEVGESGHHLLKGPRFEIQSMLIEAVCAGIGLALLPRFLIEARLRRGDIAIVSDISLTSDGAYYFAYPEEKSADPHLQRFRAWLQEHAAQFRAAEDRLARPAPG